MEVYELVCLDSFFSQKNGSADKARSYLTNLNKNCFFLDNEVECGRRVNGSQKQIVLFVSGTFGETFIKKNHENPNIISIVVFCQKVEDHQNLRSYNKVLIVSNDFKEIRRVLSSQLNPFQLGGIPISFMPEAKLSPKSTLLANEKILTFTRLLKKAVSSMPHPGDDEKDLFVKLLSHEESDKRELRTFEQDYRFPDAMNFYQKGSLVCRYLNRSLGNLEFSSMVDLGFYIHAMQQGIGFRERENREKFQPNEYILSFTASVTTQTFGMLSANKGNLLSINSFLITNRNEAMTSEEYKRIENGIKGTRPVFFKISMSKNSKVTPFAEIAGSADERNKQFIFRMQTVFVISEVKQGAKDSFNEVHLTIADDDEVNFKNIFQSIDSKTSGSGWNRVKLSLAYICREIFGCEILIEEHRVDPKARLDNEKEKFFAYEILAQMKDKGLQPQMALVYYAELLRMYRLSLPSLDNKLCLTLIKIGNFHENMQRFSEALAYYEEAHLISIETLPNHHVKLGESYERLGRIYEKLNQYQKAAEYYRHALQIKELKPSNDSAALNSLKASLDSVAKKR